MKFCKAIVLLGAAASVQNVALVTGTRGKGKRNTGVLGNVAKAVGVATALGAQGAGAAIAEDVHPLYHQTQGQLGSLLTKPCSKIGATAVPLESLCGMEARFRMWANEQKKPYIQQTKIYTATGEGSSVESTLEPSSGMASEYKERFNAFGENVARAYDYNVESKGDTVYGITKFMDMQEEEFLRKRTGMVVDEPAREKFAALPKFEKPTSSKTSQDLFLPKTSSKTSLKTEGAKDWSAEGYTTEIKDQGNCGSCWAFSTTEQVESRAIQAGISDPYGEDYVLAPQELVSCDDNGDMGCGGGLPLNALEWLEKKPLEQESDYPYTSGFSGHDGKCKLKKSKGVIEVTSFKQVSDGAEAEDKFTDYLLTEGPLSVGVDANSHWQLYTGGVMPARKCMGQLDHAVQAVGIDTEAVKPYVKVRNSWGSDWGEDGYIRLAQGTNTCGVANMAVTADVKDVADVKEREISV